MVWFLSKKNCWESAQRHNTKIRGVESSHHNHVSTINPCTIIRKRFIQIQWYVDGWVPVVDFLCLNDSAFYFDFRKYSFADGNDHEAADNDNSTYHSEKDATASHDESKSTYSDVQLESLIDSVLEMMDLDKDGYITYHEYKYQPSVYRDQHDNDVDDQNSHDGLHDKTHANKWIMIKSQRLFIKTNLNSLLWFD